MNSKMLENNTNAHFTDTQRRMPSYVSISRAISGYSEYNKYCSDLKRDSSLLDSFLTSTVSSSSTNGEHAQLLKPRDSPLVDDQVDNFCSLPYEPTQEKISLIDPSKSFLQKKIESLYGQTFAEDWRKSRLKSPSPKPNTQIEKTRSPSCPPSRIASEDVARLVTPFQKINSLDNPREKVKQLSAESNGARQLTQPSDASSAGHDGHWFLSQLNQCTTDLQVHIDRHEKTLGNSDSIPDEVVGKIRATIGKANLLINKKLNQFNQLCQDSIVQLEDQEFKIKPDDLRGFWDMVTIQVEEVNNAFDELDRLKQNNWIQVPDSESVQKPVSKRTTNSKQNTNSPRSFQKSVSPMNSPRNSKTASPNGLDRENERKSRLMEIKRKGKMKTREIAEDEITIFVPTTDLETSES